ncbi:hypothetical protein ACLI4Z_06660 [Natrialbaceae archaeon A-arb3/5]
MKRRELLACCALPATVVGCLDNGSDGELSGAVRPDSDPKMVPSGLSCADKDFERIEYQVDDDELVYGDTEHFALRIDTLTPQYGEEVAIDLVNVSSSEQTTGTHSLWRLQLYTEDGWQEVRGTTEDRGLDHAVEDLRHSPGGGISWNIQLTEDGVMEAGPVSERIEICPDLQAGRLRFVYTGTGTDDIAVQFDFEQ